MFFADYYQKKVIKSGIIRTVTLTQIDKIGRNANDWLKFKYNVSGEFYTGKVYISDDDYDYYKMQIGKSRNVKMHKNNLINRCFFTYILIDE